MSDDFLSLKTELAKRWLDPVLRCEDIFNIKTSRGDSIPYRAPEPHKDILREGPLGNARKLIDEGYVFSSVLDKGRQLGYSTLTAMETILMAEDYPNTTLFYIADEMDQTKDFLDKVEQLCKSANHYPPQLGGGPILNVQDLRMTFEKKINNTTITGLSGRSRGGKRGKNSIYVIWDEAAWCISVRNEQEEIWDVIRHYLKQGGCIRVQSTPRTTDDRFWKSYTSPHEYGMKAYYRPTIENWRELDLKQPLYIELDNERRLTQQWEPISDDVKTKLITQYMDNPRYEVCAEKGFIQQKGVNIPYPWVKLIELEKERQDYEKFMQENMGVPVDEKYKLIPTEWIYRNVTEDPERETRGDSKNPFYILIDLAQINDITAITVVEKMEDESVIERKLYATQAKYDEQVEEIWTYFLNFKPQNISIDNTGHGIVVGDLLEKKLRVNGYPPSILHRVNFTAPEKEVMAEGFRRLVQADKYKFLNRTTLHAESIRHVERVEKEVLPTSVRYSGKKWGRDDFFWSKAQIVYFTQLLMPSPPASFGKIKREVYTDTSPIDMSRIVSPEGLREEMLRKSEELNYKDRGKLRNIGRALLEFKEGVVDCPKTGKVEKPILCTGCDREECFNYDSMMKICKLLTVLPQEVWEHQKEYKEGENEEK